MAEESSARATPNDDASERARERELESSRFYEKPTLECDMVMKGGITSGVVYPLAICELATRYTFRSLGGSSAGAIAAAACAAAELGRHSEHGGFHRLATLPSYLGSSLLGLFQPTNQTRPLFELLLLQLSDKKIASFSGILAIARAVCSAPGGLRWLLVRLVPLAIVVCGGAWLVSAVAGSVSVTVALIAIVLLGACWAAWAAVRSASTFVLGAVRDSSFGVCPGHAQTAGPARAVPTSASERRRPGSDYALSDWLADELDALAGISTGDAPLCFGHLRNGSTTLDGPTSESPGIVLEMFTTNLTNGRPHRLPIFASASFNSDALFFRREELGRFFPGRIVEWMVNSPPQRVESDEESDWLDWELLLALMKGLGFFPVPRVDKFPVVVATRMSLSFPVLISAVPLWRINWSDERNDSARRSWRAWRNRHPKVDTDALIALEGAPVEKPNASICWFSDGGICSNFPIHFFDSAIPARPTFGINLRALDPGAQLSVDEGENVWLASSTTEGHDLAWRQVNDVPGFGGAIFDTIHNWNDNAQMRLHGYWDRVAHVLMDQETEGGLNLTMTESTIRRLARRGRHAGLRLAERFDPQRLTASGEPSWNRHRWLRFRTLMSQLDVLLTDFERSFSRTPLGQSVSYQDLLDRQSDSNPGTGYWWSNQLHRDFSQAETARLLQLAQAWRRAPKTFDDGAPRPRPKLRTMPPI